MKIAGRYYRVRWIALLYAFAAGSLLTVLLFESLAPSHGLVLRSGLGLLLVLAFLLLGIIAVRLVRFRTKTYTLLRRLVSGDYESGIWTSRFFKDEVTELEDLLNRLVERLRQYDVLRAGRIRQLRMTRNLVVEHTVEPMVLFDAEKGTLDFNPAMSEILGISRQSVQLDTLRNLDTNKAFSALLTQVIADEKTPQEGQINIQVPGQDSAKTVYVRVVPYKDKAENVSFAVLFVKPAIEQHKGSENLKNRKDPSCEQER